MSESSKIKPIIQKYLDRKTILDIGCGMEKITPGAIGVDMRYPTVADIVINSADIYNLHLCTKIPKVDVVFSSHCLEHLADYEGALISWRKLLKPEGKIILYLPDDRFYDNLTNKEHVHVWTLEEFLENMKRIGLGSIFKVVESGLHAEPGSKDLYSFWVVLE